MKITLKTLEIWNMRSTKHRKVDFTGRDARVSGKTEGGKTTMADVWATLWNRRDSAGKTGRGMRPVYRSGPKKDQPVRGLTSIVEATLLIAEADDQSLNGSWVLRKEEAEETNERDRKGNVEIEYSYPKEHRINGDFVLEKDFKAWVSQIADPDIIRALTDMNFFLADEKKGGMHHTKRRKLLRAMGGDIGTPKDFEDVDAAITGRTLDGYKKELTDQQGKYKEEQDSIPGFVGENQRIMGENQQGDSEADLTIKRDKVNETIMDLGEERATVLKAEQVREEAKEKLTKWETDKVKRETFLANDTSATEGLQKEAAELQGAVAQIRNVARGHADIVSELSGKRLRIKNTVEHMMQVRSGIQREYKSIKDQPAIETCFSCQQTLPPEQAATNAKRKAETLATITERGNKVHADLKAKQAELDKLQEQFQHAEERRLDTQSKLLEAEQSADKRRREIAAEMSACPRAKPEDDEEWNRIVAAIAVCEQEIGDPVAEQLAALETRKQAAEAEKASLDKALKDTDKTKECMDRVAELEARQKELAQMIITTSGKLHRVQLYQKAESELIANAVNGRFKGVEFKLFRECLNGEIEPCCEALDDGISYPEMSGGQKIRASVGAIAALSTYYKLWMPLFIDNRQDLTEPLDLDMQTIELYAVEGVEELEVVLDDAKEVKVA